jgi:endonuclease/exonuclease/phosphatase family metal-dependent hydrolase
VRAGTLNVRWFPHGRARRNEPGEGTNVGWLACIVAWLDLDVLAVQEFVQDLEGRRATAELLETLEAHTGSRWSAAFDECAAGGRQHVGFLWAERRVALDPVRTIAEINPTGTACGRSLRPGIAAYARFARTSPRRPSFDGWLLNVHLDSGTAARDHDHRVASLGALARLEPILGGDDADVIVLGDMNTMGCAGCEPAIDAPAELASLEGLLARGSPPLARLSSPVGCTEYYGSRAGVLDHVLVRRGLEELPRSAELEVHGPCARLACGRPNVAMRGYLDAISDHCPLVVSLRARDMDH